jgi:hypothetical protein
LRGYAWLTIIGQELADRLGSVDVLTASGVFWEVAPLAKGAVWLQATEDFRDYDQATAERLFAMLAPVLRPGLPERPTASHIGPYYLVYEDAAASPRAGGGPNPEPGRAEHDAGDPAADQAKRLPLPTSGPLAPDRRMKSDVAIIAATND